MAHSTLEIERLHSILTPAEIHLLASYLFDHQTQRQLARARRKGQSTIGRRLRTAVAKLQNAGLDVQLRRRGRRKGRARPLSQIMHRFDDSTLLNSSTDDREAQEEISDEYEPTV